MTPKEIFDYIETQPKGAGLAFPIDGELVIEEADTASKVEPLVYAKFGRQFLRRLDGGPRNKCYWGGQLIGWLRGIASDHLYCGSGDWYLVTIGSKEGF